MAWTMTLIGACGAVGAVARYLLGGWIQAAWGGPFPVGTLVVNVAGCACIGVLMALFLGPTIVPPEWRLAILIGLLGGFTTFSSFGWETVALINDGQFSRALLNVVVTNVAGISVVWLTYRLGQRWIGA